MLQSKCGDKSTIDRKEAYFTVTPEALTKLHSLMKNQKDVIGMKVSFKIGGCNGVSHKLEFAKENVNISPKDDTFEIDGINFFVDKRVFFSVFDSVLNYHTSNVSSGFVFQKETKGGCCGAGFC